MDLLLSELEKVGCDISGGLRRFCNNEQLYLKYLHQFPEENTLSKFLNALECKDYKCAYEEIHTLKGLTGSLSLTVLFELSQEIMQLLKIKEYDMIVDCTKELCLKHKELIQIIQAQSI